MRFRPLYRRLRPWPSVTAISLPFLEPREQGAGDFPGWRRPAIAALVSVHFLYQRPQGSDQLGDRTGARAFGAWAQIAAEQVRSVGILPLSTKTVGRVDYLRRHARLLLRLPVWGSGASRLRLPELVRR